MKTEGHPYDVNKQINAFLSNVQEKYIKAEITIPRRNDLHNKFFVFCQKVAGYQKLPLDTVRRLITIKAGHYTPYPINDDYTYLEAKSISFSKMSQDEFDLFYEKAVLGTFEIWQFTDDQHEDLISFP